MTSATITSMSAAVSEEKHEFDLQLGRALDTLRSDYPDMLTCNPDYSIYDDRIEVKDPSGFTLKGIRNYKQAFSLVHAIVNLFYCPEKSLLTFRMIYDCAHNHIRISWNAHVVPKKLFGGTKTTLHVDGISVYELNSSGKVIQHRVEHLMINDRPVVTEQGIFMALDQLKVGGECSPAYFGIEQNQIVPFATVPSFGHKESLLEPLYAVSSSTSPDHDNTVDWEALERKNKSRKKFGLDPLTPEEFLELEAQVQQMTKQSQQNQPQTTTTVSQKRPQKNFIKQLFGNVLEDTCESNFDCQRPQVCCDFGFKKMCCASGQMVSNMQPVRIPVTKDSGYMNGW
jgi:hypothetical protein